MEDSVYGIYLSSLEELKENRRQFRRISRKLQRDIQKLEKEQSALKQTVIDLVNEDKKELARNMYQEQQKVKQKISQHYSLKAKVVVMEMQLSSQMAYAKVKEATQATSQFLQLAADAPSMADVNQELKLVIQKLHLHQDGEDLMNEESVGESEVRDAEYFRFLTRNGLIQELPQAPESEVMIEKESEAERKIEEKLCLG